MIGYTILRFRFLRTDDIVRRGFMYVLLTVLVVIRLCGVGDGRGLIIQRIYTADSPYLVGGFIFLLALLLEPIRTRLQGMVDTMFFRGERAYAEQLRGFFPRLTTALDLQTIGTILREQISLHPDPRAGSTFTPTIHSTTFTRPARRRPPPDERHSLYGDKSACPIF